MMLARVAMSHIQTATHMRVLLTPVSSQQPGITSHVQILRRQPSDLPARSLGRKYGPLAASLKGTSGWSASLGRLVIVAILYGGVTMKLSTQNRISLSRKTAATLK